MTENFADLWISKYGETPNEENSRSWRVALTGLTRAQIETGLKQIVIQCLDYPPVPPKFRGLCLSNDDDEAEILFQEVTKWGQLDQSQKSRKGLWIIQNMENWHYFKDFANEIKARKMFDTAYRKLQKFLANGGELPEFLVEIEYETPPVVPNHERAKTGFFSKYLISLVDNPSGGDYEPNY